MKREHITLPALQLAAAAFFATVCQAQAVDAGVTYCVDNAEKVVDASNCDGTGPAGTFFVAQGPFAAHEAVGTRLTAQPVGKTDSSDPVARKAAGLPETGSIVRRGFGKRNAQDEEKTTNGG